LNRGPGGTSHPALRAKFIVEYLSLPFANLGKDRLYIAVVTTVSLALLLPVLITVSVRAMRQTTKVVRAQPAGQAGIARVTKHMYRSNQELAIAQALLTVCSLKPSGLELSF
jgi:hypothetical protein